MSIFLKKNKPILIGLTGGIGSGKTTVSKVFQALGCKVFNSDNVAKQLLNNDVEIKSKVINLFGEVYNENNINSKKLAAAVFNDASLLHKLNNIIHPRVKEEFESWMLNNSNEKLLIKEAAILIESNAHKQLDDLILVITNKEDRIKRVITRDKSTRKEVLQRIENQLNDDEKKKHCKYIVFNNEKDLLIPQVELIYKDIIYSSSSSISSSE